jgi:hypothetical protein
MAGRRRDGTHLRIRKRHTASEVRTPAAVGRVARSTAVAHRSELHAPRSKQAMRTLVFESVSPVPLAAARLLSTHVLTCSLFDSLAACSSAPPATPQPALEDEAAHHTASLCVPCSFLCALLSCPRPSCLLHGGERLQNWPQEEQGTPLATAHGGSNGERGDTHQRVCHRLPYTAQQATGQSVHPPWSAPAHSTGPDWSTAQPICPEPGRDARGRGTHRWMRLSKVPPAPDGKTEAPMGRKVMREKRVLPKLLGPFFLRHLGPPSDNCQFLLHGARTRTENRRG